MMVMKVRGCWEFVVGLDCGVDGGGLLFVVFWFVECVFNLLFAGCFGWCVELMGVGLVVNVGMLLC